MDERPSIAFIGAGRVAGMLARAFADLGYPVPAVASRSPESAQRVASLVPGCRALSPQEAAEPLRSSSSRRPTARWPTWPRLSRGG